MSKFASAGLTAGQLNAIVKKLGGHDAALAFLRDELKLVLVEVTTNRHVDCDAPPFCPNGWTVVEHKKGGQIEFDPKKIAFHLDPAQKTGVITGHNLRKNLANEPVLNANILDHLLAHRDLIPEEWKVDEQGRTRFIFFLGTVYCFPDGDLYVRYLCWYDGQWDWYDHWLDCDFGDQYPAAISAS